jgi:hypothetical protein
MEPMSVKLKTFLRSANAVKWTVRPSKNFQWMIADHCYKDTHATQPTAATGSPPV